MQTNGKNSYFKNKSIFPVGYQQIKKSETYARRKIKMIPIGFSKSDHTEGLFRMAGLKWRHPNIQRAVCYSA
jgi:hypothetical protein